MYNQKKAKILFFHKINNNNNYQRSIKKIICKIGIVIKNGLQNC